MARAARLPRAGEAAIRALIDRYDLHARLALPVPIRQIAQQENWHVIYREGMNPLYAFAVIHGSAQIMYVNADVTSPYQRMAIAHEMGHLLNGDRAILHLSTQGPRPMAQWTTRRMERQAQLAAARILIPDWTLAELDTIEEIAAACEVPMELVELVARLR